MEFRDLKELWSEIESMETLTHHLMEYVERCRVQIREVEAKFEDLFAIAKALRTSCSNNTLRLNRCDLRLGHERYTELVKWYVRADMFLDVGQRLMHVTHQSCFVHPSLPPMIAELVTKWKYIQQLLIVFV